MAKQKKNNDLDVLPVPREAIAALRDEEEAKRVIAAVPKRHPFEMRYDRVENVDWESCSRVPDSASQLEALRKGW
jgi:hypothetical protein